MECTSANNDWLKLARDVLQTEIEGLQSVSQQLGPSFEKAVTAMAQCTGRVVVTGVGKSGLVDLVESYEHALDAA